MRFINPKTDFAFKRIFGSEQSREVLIDFLDAVLYGSRGLIADLEILNPWLAPRIRGMKDTFLDVRARLNDGREVIIEMQVLNVEGFEKRILYNAAKTYSSQLRSGENYLDLHPVIALTLTDFVMFESCPGYLSRFVLRERDYLMDYPVEDLELAFIELPKFEKPLEQLDGRLEQWLYFIKHAPDLTMIPPNWAAVPALRQAFDLANRMNLDPEELEDLERREIFIADQRNALLKAQRQGHVEGHAEGQREQTMEIARALLDVLDLDTIAAKTGLSVDELRRLR
jgi:predicted transposase/invertase (TIGR01784 family)